MFIFGIILISLTAAVLIYRFVKGGGPDESHALIKKTLRVFFALLNGGLFGVLLLMTIISAAMGNAFTLTYTSVLEEIFMIIFSVTVFVFFFFVQILAITLYRVILKKNFSTLEETGYLKWKKRLKISGISLLAMLALNAILFLIMRFL